MKNYLNYIKEENEIKIIELSYFDFINVCDTYETVDITDNYNNNICSIINSVKENPETFSKISNKYHFLVAIQDKKIYGVFYKSFKGNSSDYTDGYIISKGVASLLFKEMQKIGEYITFSNLENIASLKSQLSTGAEIICICDNPPNKDTGYYNPDFTDSGLKQMLIDEKIYYKCGSDVFLFYDDKEQLKVKELNKFLLDNKNVSIIQPSDDIGRQIKVYLKFKKL